jgi:hypothetical protein
VENLIPFELDIYIDMIKEHVRELEEKQRNNGG